MPTHIVEQLRDLVGRDVVLLPIPPGEKGPRFTGWQNVTAASMEDPAYLARLNHGGNIGVLLGQPSGGLCSIDVDDDAALDEFLALNPALQATLRTRRARGGNLWVRVQGDYPPLTKLIAQDGRGWGEWRADGGQTVIHGAAMDARKGESAPVPYLMLVAASPVCIRFADIVWPARLIVPGTPAAANDAQQAAAELMDQFGAPYYQNNNGTIALNENYWAGHYALEHILLYEPDEKTFYEYHADTGLYEEISADRIKAEISARLLAASRESNVPALERKRTDSALNHIIAQLKGLVEKRRAFSDRASNYIHLANGILQFQPDREIDLLPFAPDFYSRNRSPIGYDDSAHCERFLNELVLPAVHPEDVALIQKYLGLCLLGRNLIQRFLILDGEGGRGKTQLAIVFQHLIGMANVTQLRTEHLAERFELYRYLKRTLLVGVDVSANFLSTRGANVLKGLVGGDWMDAEQKGGNGNFQLQGIYCVLITSNSRLRVRLEGDLSAWRRRMLIVRYEAPPPVKKIPDFGKYLIETEGAGILNWALAGLAALLTDIANIGDIHLTERQQQTVDSLLAESDSLRHFLADCVELAEGCDLTVAELVEAYAEYCPSKHWKSMPITQVYDQLEGLMLEMFGTVRANSIEREGRRGNRGFRRVRFTESFRPGAAAKEALF